MSVFTQNKQNKKTHTHTQKKEKKKKKKKERKFIITPYGEKFYQLTYWDKI